MARLPAAALMVAAVVGVCLSSASPASAQSPPYTNHTVGGTAGWVFDPATNKPAADYSSWASKQTFSLGDYLIFNTNANSTVIQTYNKTTYGLCNLDQDDGNLTSEWSSQHGADGVPPNGAVEFAVPLTSEGDNYYFSSAGDGIQCKNGMRFHIAVAHGRGLPPDLSQPPPPPPTAPAGPPPSTPVEATPGSQSETFYRGDGGGGGRGEGRRALGFSLCFLLLLLSSA